MKKPYIYTSLLLLFFVFGLISCEDVSDNVIPHRAAPVLGVFNQTYNADSTILSVQATFYELDKSGIMDHTVGIDSIPVANLPVAVYINENISLGALTTDANGEVFFEKELSALSGASVLEWAGTYQDTPFRIRQGFAK